MKKIILLITFLCLVPLSAQSSKIQLPPYNISYLISSEIANADYHSRINLSASMSIGRTIVPKINFLNSNIEAGISLAMRYSENRNTQYFFLPGFFGMESKWTRTDSKTTTNSSALNGYIKFNFFQESSFMPFIGLSGGISTSYTKTYSETRESEDFDKKWEDWTFVSKEEKYLGGDPASTFGLTLGFNYFITYNLSFSFQYDLTIPSSEDIQSFNTIFWGIRWWF